MATDARIEKRPLRENISEGLFLRKGRTLSKVSSWCRNVLLIEYRSSAKCCEDRAIMTVNDNGGLTTPA